MIDSIEHLEVYMNMIKDYLKKKGISDLTKFEVALSHDKPHYIRWDYPIEKPAEAMLLKEFKIDLSAPRKIQNLAFEYIYIHATSIAHKLRIDNMISIHKEPIYFNVHGDVIPPKEVKEETFDKSKNIIESILKVDLERTSNVWISEDNLFMKKISVENGMLKFFHQPIYLPTNGLIRVLVAYQNKVNKVRATELVKVIIP